MLFTLIERFKDRDAVYRRNREHGLGDNMRVSINDGLPKVDAPRLMALFLAIKGH